MRPERYRNAVVPHIYVDGAAEAIAFYSRAFGAKELFRILREDGTILHSEISISGSTLMIGDPNSKEYADPRSLGASTASLHLMLDDNRASMLRAVEAGCQIIQPPADMFYGANSATIRDPFGHVWVLLTWKVDMDPAEIERTAQSAIS
jgi:PhnB protein